MTTAPGLAWVTLEQPYVELESGALPLGDPGAGDVRRIQPSSRHQRPAGTHLDPSDGFDPAEFADFLEADDTPMPADPAFKERLRQRLWGMVRENADVKAPPVSPRGSTRLRPTLPDPKPKPPR